MDLKEGARQLVNPLLVVWNATGAEIMDAWKAQQ